MQSIPTLTRRGRCLNLLACLCFIDTSLVSALQTICSVWSKHCESPGNAGILQIITHTHMRAHKHTLLRQQVVFEIRFFRTSSAMHAPADPQQPLTLLIACRYDSITPFLSGTVASHQNRNRSWLGSASSSDCACCRNSPCESRPDR